MGKNRFKWITGRKKTEPEVPYETPIWLGDLSNGEFYLPQSEKKRKIRELILQRCDENARRLNMDRREFMASTMGMATTLSVLNFAAGCGDDNGNVSNGAVDDMLMQRGQAGYSGNMPPQAPGGGSGISSAGAAGRVGGAGAPGAPAQVPAGGPAGRMSTPSMPTGGTPTTVPGGNGGAGGFQCSKAMEMDQALADKVFGGDYFILDFQTHHTQTGGGPVLDGCMDGRECTSPDAYVRKIFEQSDTTVAVLSGLPSMVNPQTGDLTGFSNEQMVSSRDRINKGAKLTADAHERMLAHCQVSPVQNPQANAMMMEKFKTMFDTRGWKCYPPADRFYLDQQDDFIQTAIKLKEPLICAHKGFPFTGWSVPHADPGVDVANACKKYPDVNFVIYHSAFDTITTEGAYNDAPDPMHGGTDRLWKVAKDNNLQGKNLYAEMGAAWAIAMMDPLCAQHYIGKGLKYLGEDRMVWGTECTWFGSPQNQIEAMKVFKISEEFQTKYGYPAFTDDIRRKIFGLNGAPLYRIEPCALRFKVARSDLMAHKMNMDDFWGPRRHAINYPVIRTRRDLFAYREHMRRSGEIG